MAHTSSSSSKRRTWDLHRAGKASKIRKARSSVLLPAHAAIEADIEAENKKFSTLVNGIRERLAGRGPVRNVKAPAGGRSPSEAQVRLLKQNEREKARRSGRQAKKTKARELSARNDLDVFPNEILGHILRLLHSSFHSTSYLNALLDLPTSTTAKPWNPVDLQSVCRSWRDVCRPLYYAQVVLDPANVTSLELLHEMDTSWTVSAPHRKTSHQVPYPP